MLTQTPRAGAGNAEADLALSGIVRRFRDVTALAGIDLAVHRGELVTILGPSGSGKTTLLKIIAGFELPDNGVVRLKGEDISFTAVGENIYADDYRDRVHLAEHAIGGWLNNTEHRATMLSDKFTETGVGVAQSDDGKTYVTQDFIR